MNMCFGMPPIIQSFIIALLFIVSISVGILDLHLTGTHFGYQPSISILFAPLYEELFFRGLLLGFLVSKTTVFRSLILSSVLFGFWHYKNALFIPLDLVVRQMVYTAVFVGPILALITLKTNSVWMAVIVHYLHNIVAELLRVM